MPASMQYKLIGLGEAIAEVKSDLSVPIREMIKPVSKELAKGIRSGQSQWPVRTGLSKRSFRGSDDGLVNEQDYAPYVEERTGAAAHYVLRNIEPVAQEVLDSLIKKRNG